MQRSDLYKILDIILNLLLSGPKFLVTTQSSVALNLWFYLKIKIKISHR
jgi:hypothetical protein